MSAPITTFGTATVREMQHSKLVLSGSSGQKRVIEANLTDFNRMRWAIAALRSNEATSVSIKSALFDSTCVTKDTQLPDGSHVVLWDGLQSLTELHSSAPDVARRSDLQFLYVGQLADVSAAFPCGARPLFENSAADRASLRNTKLVRAPALFELQRQIRTALRPWRNRQISKDRHLALQRGGRIVFCGAVRPTKAILDSFFVGGSLPALRVQLSTLEGIEWAGDLSHVERHVKQALTFILKARPARAAELSCLYALLNTLHRVGTLAVLHRSAAPLLVNEYGFQTHLDPYDAFGYQNNLFVDFGSTRGPDLVYPRTVDLLLTKKPTEQLRLIDSTQYLQAFLDAATPDGFWQLCAQHAQRLRQRQTQLFEI
jgi:hypothetical protein